MVIEMKEFDDISLVSFGQIRIQGRFELLIYYEKVILD
jgi:hypothetical protein